MQNRCRMLAALTLVICLLSGGLVPGLGEETVTLRWITVGRGAPQNYAKWKERVDSYLLPRIGVRLEMEVVPWADWKERRAEVLSSGEPWDILFGGGSTFLENARDGQLMEITAEALLAYAPELTELIPADYWRPCLISGRIYGVPTYKDNAMTHFFVWDQELLSQNGLDASLAHSLQEAEPLLMALQALKPDQPVFPLNAGGASFILSPYDSFGSGLPAIGVRAEDESASVVPVFEQADVLENLRTLHFWYQQGIINQDAPLHPEEHQYKVCSVAQGWPSAAKTVWGPQMGTEAVAYQLGTGVLSNATVRSSVNAISARCLHPDKALALLNLVNSDVFLRDSFYYGLEGEDWVYTPEGQVHRLKQSWPMAGYTQGNLFIVSDPDTDAFSAREEIRLLNECAIPSVLLGFSFDAAPVQDILSACRSIYEKWQGQLLTGAVHPDEAVPAMMAELEAAGLEQLMAEAQSQIDLWRQGR